MPSLPISSRLHRAPLVLLGLALAATSPLSAAEEKSGVTFETAPGVGLDRPDTRPIPVPDKIDPRYTADALTQAFRKVCEKLGYRIIKLQVDTSEYPFLLYGEIDGRAELRGIREAFSDPAYTYAGSVTSHSSRYGTTKFVVDITPPTHYSRESSYAIRQRTIERMRKLAETAAFFPKSPGR